MCLMLSWVKTDDLDETISLLDMGQWGGNTAMYQSDCTQCANLQADTSTFGLSSLLSSYCSSPNL